MQNDRPDPAARRQTPQTGTQARTRISAFLPASDTGRPASQYLAMRVLTPAATAQCSAVFLGQMPRAAAAWIVVQPIAPGGNELPRIPVDGDPTNGDDCPMTQPHTQTQHEKLEGRDNRHRGGADLRRDVRRRVLSRADHAAGLVRNKGALMDRISEGIRALTGHWPMCRNDDNGRVPISPAEQNKSPGRTRPKRIEILGEAHGQRCSVAASSRAGLDDPCQHRDRPRRKGGQILRGQAGRLRGLGCEDRGPPFRRNAVSLPPLRHRRRPSADG